MQIKMTEEPALRNLGVGDAIAPFQVPSLIFYKLMLKRV